MRAARAMKTIGRRATYTKARWCPAAIVNVSPFTTKHGVRYGAADNLVATPRYPQPHKSYEPLRLAKLHVNRDSAVCVNHIVSYDHAAFIEPATARQAPLGARW